MYRSGVVIGLMTIVVAHRLTHRAQVVAPFACIAVAVGETTLPIAALPVGASAIPAISTTT